MKLLYLMLAWICVGLGTLGIFLPLLPTTPFLLLALFLFGKSNPAWARWLRQNRYLGVYIRCYTQQKRMPLKLKMRIIFTVWVTIGLSAAFCTETLWVRALLGVIAIAVSLHIALLRTRTGVD